MSSYNLYGGTPKKTLDLLTHFGKDSVLFVYHDSYSELKPQFEATGSKIYEGFYGNNYIKYVKQLLKIIDSEGINIVQTQFTKGEALGFLIKLFRTDIKLLYCFVGSLPSPLLKLICEKIFFYKADAFIFISNYVRLEKENQFPFLKQKITKTIYNGTGIGIDTRSLPCFNNMLSLLCISGLIPIKNIQVLIEAMFLIINQRKFLNIHLYVAGDGPMRVKLEEQIERLNLKEYIHLLGYQENIGGLLNNCDIYVHPCYKEGFGIAVAEAMHSQKPIIVSDAGALPELIDHEKTGLIATAHDPNAWANAIIRLIENPKLAEDLAYNAKIKAQIEFSIERFVNNYAFMYQSILQEKE
jgi:glycosyltransferase involved in cell wall biosynthesis